MSTYTNPLTQEDAAMVLGLELKTIGYKVEKWMCEKLYLGNPTFLASIVSYIVFSMSGRLSQHIEEMLPDITGMKEAPPTEILQTMFLLEESVFNKKPTITPHELFSLKPPDIYKRQLSFIQFIKASKRCHNALVVEARAHFISPHLLEDPPPKEEDDGIELDDESRAEEVSKLENMTEEELDAVFHKLAMNIDDDPDEKHDPDFDPFADYDDPEDKLQSQELTLLSNHYCNAHFRKNSTL